MSKLLRTQGASPQIPEGFLDWGQMRFAPGFTPAAQPTTRRRCPCSWRRCRTMPRSGAGPLGAVAGRPGDDAPGADRPRCRIRFPVRSARPDHPERPGAGRNAGRVCRVRAGYLAGSREGGNRPSPEGWEAVRAAPDCRQARPGNKAVAPGGAELSGNRPVPRG